MADNKAEIQCSVIYLSMADPVASSRDPKFRSLIERGWSVMAHLPARRPGTNHDDWLLLMVSPDHTQGPLRLHDDDRELLSSIATEIAGSCETITDEIKSSAGLLTEMTAELIAIREQASKPAGPVSLSSVDRIVVTSLLIASAMLPPVSPAMTKA